MSIGSAQIAITKAILEWEGMHAQPHHVLPETGWVSFYLRRPEDDDRRT